MGLFQARVPEWVAISFSRGSSQPRDWAPVSRIAGRCFTLWATREAVNKSRDGRFKPKLSKMLFVTITVGAHEHFLSSVFCFFKGCVCNEAGNFVSLVTDNDEAAVSKRGQDPATHSSSLLPESSWGFLYHSPPTLDYSTHLEDHQSSWVPSLYRWRNQGSETQRGSGLMETLQWHWKPSLATQLYPTPYFLSSGCSDMQSEWMQIIITEGWWMF